jgi:hypothetical protein
MNYERLKNLATLLNKAHGEPDRHGFIVAPHDNAMLDEYKKALTHADRMFNYEPISDERLGILAVTREQGERVDYPHTKLEHMGYEKLVTPETEHLLMEYMEYIKSRRD